MEKFISIIKIPIIIIITFLLQIVISNNFELFGVTPNIIIVTVVIVSMWNKSTVGLIVGGIAGALSDLIFHFDIGETFIAYLAVAICVSFISKKYRKESKAAIIYITVMATCIFAVFQFIYGIMDNNLIINIFALIKQITIEILLNIAIAYIIYKVFEKSIKDSELDNFYR